MQLLISNIQCISSFLAFHHSWRVIPGITCKVPRLNIADGGSNTGGAVLQKFFDSEQLHLLSQEIDPQIPTGASMKHTFSTGLSYSLLLCTASTFCAQLRYLLRACRCGCSMNFLPW